MCVFVHLFHLFLNIKLFLVGLCLCGIQFHLFVNSLDGYVIFLWFVKKKFLWVA